MNDLNLQETNRLRRLDEIVMSGMTARAEVIAGEAIVQPYALGGYVAELMDTYNITRQAFGPTPMIALFRVTDTVREINAI